MANEAMGVMFNAMGVMFNMVNCMPKGKGKRADEQYSDQCFNKWMFEIHLNIVPLTVTPALVTYYINMQNIISYCKP